MQVVLGSIQCQPRERLDEQQRQENKVADASANSQPLWARKTAPLRPYSGAVVRAAVNRTTEGL